MAWTSRWTLIVLLGLLPDTKGQNPQITCTFAGWCVLPCHIRTNSGDELIHWYNVKNNESPVHSYYDKADQLQYQDKGYAGRTLLFKDLITSGNASLKLSAVKLSDEGTYKCYTSTSTGYDEKFVDVKVVVPVQVMDITVSEDSLSCSSEKIYQAPSLAWTTATNTPISPEKAPETQRDAQGLYSISSTVKSSDTLVCTITAGASTKRVSGRYRNLSAERDTVTIPCTVPEKNLKDFTLTWRFNDDTILTFDSRSSTPEVSKQWQNRVNYIPPQTSITLQGLLSDNGTYRCEVITPDLRHLELTSITTGTERKSDSSLPISIGVSVLLIVIGTIAAVIAFVVKKKMHSDSGTPRPEDVALNPDNSKTNGKNTPEG